MIMDSHPHSLQIHYKSSPLTTSPYTYHLTVGVNRTFGSQRPFTISHYGLPYFDGKLRNSVFNIFELNVLFRRPQSPWPTPGTPFLPSECSFTGTICVPKMINSSLSRFDCKKWILFLYFSHPHPSSVWPDCIITNDNGLSPTPTAHSLQIHYESSPLTTRQP